jgi:plastocyanin
MARRNRRGRALGAGHIMGLLAIAAGSALPAADAAAAAVQGKVQFPPASETKATLVQAKVYRRFPVAQAPATEVTQFQVVVTIDSPTPVPVPAPVVVTSNGYMLDPVWVVVPVGTEVKFENQDRFALSLEISGEPRPPTLRHGESHVQKFTKAGLYQISAREWEHMRANVLVLENKLFATPDNSGVFKIPDVQSGVKTARVYVNGQEVAKTDVQVPADADTWVEVKVDAEGKAVPEVRGSGLLPANAKSEGNVQPTPAKPEAKPEGKAEKPHAKPKPKPQPQPKPAQPAAGNGEAPPPPPPPPPSDDDDG